MNTDLSLFQEFLHRSGYKQVAPPDDLSDLNPKEFSILPTQGASDIGFEVTLDQGSSLTPCYVSFYFDEDGKCIGHGVTE